MMSKAKFREGLCWNEAGPGNFTHRGFSELGAEGRNESRSKQDGYLNFMICETVASLYKQE